MFITLQTFMVVENFIWMLSYRVGEECCKFRSLNQKSNGTVFCTVFLLLQFSVHVRYEKGMFYSLTNCAFLKLWKTQFKNESFDRY